MSIRTCLNELFKHNKVAEKAKRITATALVAGTILAGAGLTACEMDESKTQGKQIYFQIEQKLKDYKKVDDNFQLDIILVLKNDMPGYNIQCSDIDESSENSRIKTFVTYSLSEEQFNTIYKFAKKHQEYDDIAIYDTEDLGMIDIEFNAKAIQNKNYESIFEFILNIMNEEENPIIVNCDDLIYGDDLIYEIN